MSKINRVFLKLLFLMLAMVIWNYSYAASFELIVHNNTSSDFSISSPSGCTYSPPRFGPSSNTFPTYTVTFFCPNSGNSSTGSGTFTDQNGSKTTFTFSITISNGKATGLTMQLTGNNNYNVTTDSGPTPLYLSVPPVIIGGTETITITSK
jgi:hypothetical protein